MRALVGKRYLIEGIGQAELTEGVFCALEILTDGNLNSSEAPAIFAAAFTVLGAVDLSGHNLAETLKLPTKQLKTHLFLRFRKIASRKKLIAAASETAAEAAKDYRESICVYKSFSAGKGGTPRKTIPGAGTRAAFALFAESKLGLSWEQYLKTPATTIMTLYAAECDRNGLWGLDTFSTREIFATQLDKVRAAQAKLDAETAKENERREH